MLTGLIIGGAILLGLGTVCTGLGNILRDRENAQIQKDLIDYEYSKLGRRDETPKN